MKSRYSFPDENVSDGTFILLTEEEWECFTSRGQVEIPERHKVHFSRVLRKPRIYTLILCDGNGKLCEAQATGKIYEKKGVERKLPLPERQTVLLQAELKNKAMSMVLQKSAELGISQIIFLHTDHCQVKTRHESRFLTILENACMQSKNPFLPKIKVSEKKLAEYSFKEFDKVFWGDPAGNPSKEMNIVGNLVAFINGPEGGWSEPEKNILKNNFPCVSFSENVLRAETSALCASFWLNQG